MRRASAVASAIIAAMLLGGYVTIVLEEQGVEEMEPSARNGASDPVQVRIVDEPDPDAAGEQAEPDLEGTQERIVNSSEDAESASDPHEPAAEEEGYAQKRLADLKEEARRRGDAVPLDDFDSREMLEVLDLDVKKISPSRGSIKEILFVVRNLGDVPIHPRAELRVETIITNPDFPRIEHVEFDLKEIPSGMKIEKRAYLDIEFRPLGYERKWSFHLLNRNYPPAEIDSTGGRFTLE